MLSEAISKLKTEIEGNKTNPYIQVVGEFILQHVNKNPQDAEKILNPEKTILKSLDEMKKAAEKKKVGSCAVLTDQEGFAVILKYFGIEATALIAAQVAAPAIDISAATNPNTSELKPKIDFEVKLEDFL